MPDTTINYDALAQAVMRQFLAGSGGGAPVRAKAVSGTPTNIYGHGPGGLFSNPALERPVFSAMLLPNTGLAAALPVKRTQYTDPLYGILTGVTATSGSEADGVCDDPPTVGTAKLCMHTAVLGRLSRQTRVFDIDRAGKLTDRGEHTDFQIYGSPRDAGEQNPFVPTIPNGGGMAQVANNEVAKALFEFGVAWSRDFARLTFTGNPSNNTAGGGYKEFKGLDLLINTGYVDAITNAPCAAADSVVRDFGSRQIQANGALLVQTLTYMYRNAQYLAARANLQPVRFAFVMSWAAFYEIVNIWPVSYDTFRAAALIPTNATLFVNSESAVRTRDQMMGDMDNRTGQYLLIDGQRVPVILDDAITETQSVGGVFTSDIYLVPLTVLGGTEVLFWEYFDYNSPGGAMEMARAMAPEGSFQTSDNGRFLWHKKPPTNFCIQMLAKMEPRLMLLTPYLAARLENVSYVPLIPVRSSFPSDASTYVNGGQTNYNGYGPSYWD